jgi:hypothetical protein
MIKCLTIMLLFLALSCTRSTAASKQTEANRMKMLSPEFIKDCEKASTWTTAVKLFNCTYTLNNRKIELITCAQAVCWEGNHE